MAERQPMAEAYLGLLSRRGDRLGHLVRGVQMLHSYGRECEIRRASGVYAGTGPEGEYLCAALAIATTAGPEQLEGICREVEWALGRDDDADPPLNLDVDVWLYPGATPGAPGQTLLHPAVQSLPPAGAALAEVGAPVPGLAPPVAPWPGAELHLPAAEFAQICQLGQRSGPEGEEVIGRQPSAGGWGAPG